MGKSLRLGELRRKSCESEFLILSYHGELAQAIEGFCRGVDRDIRQPAFFKRSGSR